MNLYRNILEKRDAGIAFVLGTVIDTAGSTPQKPGCQALLDAEGALLGTLGGGLVEAEALEQMRAAAADRAPRLIEKRLDEAYSRTAGPICGGVMRIFVNPRVSDHAVAVEKALEAIERRERGVLMTHLGEGMDQGRMEWYAIANGSGPAQADAVRQVLLSERPGVVSLAEGQDVFVEPIVPVPRLLVVGGGHVGQAVVRQAARLGFEITVFDDRPEFTRVELFPEGVVTAHGNVGELVAQYPKDRDTYIVLVSKGHKPDADALERCIHDEVAYLGMIGSKRKVRLLRSHFIEEGLASEDIFDRVVAPIGYDIGAVTVPEIAVSIAAQLVAARRNPQAVREIGIKAL